MKTIHIIICCALLAMTGCKETARQQEKDNNYPTKTVKRENRQLSATYPATLRGRQDVEIRPQVSGKVTKVCVSEGAHVSKGQTLFVIDQTPYREALMKAKAAFATAIATEANVRQSLTAQRKLREQNVVSDFALHTEENNYKSAVAQVEQARAAVREAQNNLSYSGVNGAPGVSCMVYQIAGTNANEIITNIDNYLNQLKQTLPDDIEIVDLVNTKDFLSASINEVVKALFEAIVLVVLVVFIFLGNLRPLREPARSFLRPAQCAVRLARQYAFVTPTFFIVFQWIEERVRRK